MFVDDVQLSKMVNYHRTTAANEYLPDSVREVSAQYESVLTELQDYRKRKVA
jgi:hypothetical protein